MRRSDSLFDRPPQSQCRAGAPIHLVFTVSVCLIVELLRNRQATMPPHNVLARYRTTPESELLGT
jgi:hypothetical protein